MESKQTLPLYNIDSKSPHLSKLLYLFGLITVCVTVYFTTSNFKPTSCHCNDIPDNAAASITTTSDILVASASNASNMSTVHPRDMGQISGLCPNGDVWERGNRFIIQPSDFTAGGGGGHPFRGTSGTSSEEYMPGEDDVGIFNRCCADGGSEGAFAISGRSCKSSNGGLRGGKCVGIEPNWTMSEREVDKEALCIREHAVQVTQHGFWSADPLLRLIQVAMHCSGMSPGFATRDGTGMAGGTGMFDASLLGSLGERNLVSNWIPVQDRTHLRNGVTDMEQTGVRYEFRLVNFPDGIQRQNLSQVEDSWFMPISGPLTGMRNETHALSLYLPYWKRRLVRMFREMPRNTDRQSCVEMMRAHGGL